MHACINYACDALTHTHTHTSTQTCIYVPTWVRTIYRFFCVSIYVVDILEKTPARQRWTRFIRTIKMPACNECTLRRIPPREKRSFICAFVTSIIAFRVVEIYIRSEDVRIRNHRLHRSFLWYGGIYENIQRLCMYAHILYMCVFILLIH